MKHLLWLQLLFALACAREGITVVSFGDSTTLWRGPELNWTRLVEQQLSSPERLVRVVNAGRSSDDTDLARRRFWWDVMRHRPDLVTLQFGINDATVDPGRAEARVPLDRYVENLRYFADRVRDLGGQAVLLTPNPVRPEPAPRRGHPDPPDRPRDPRDLDAALEDYAAAIRQLARSEGLALVDLHRAFEESELGGGPPVQELLMDGIHPNDSGHRLVAREVGSVLGAALAPPRASRAVP